MKWSKQFLLSFFNHTLQTYSILFDSNFEEVWRILYYHILCILWWPNIIIIKDTAMCDSILLMIGVSEILCISISQDPVIYIWYQPLFLRISDIFYLNQGHFLDCKVWTVFDRLFSWNILIWLFIQTYLSGLFCSECFLQTAL